MLKAVNGAGWCVAAAVAAAVLSGGCEGTGKTNAQLRIESADLANRGETEAAIAVLQPVLERTPEDTLANWQMGLLLLETGDPLRALRHLEVAYAHVASNSDLAYEVGGHLAEAMYQNREHDRAFSFLQDRAAASQSARDYNRLGAYALRVNDPDSAAAAYTEAARVSGATSVEPYLGLAEVHLSLGQTEEAVRRLRMAYTIDPTNPEVIEALTPYVGVIGPSLRLTPEP